jgi:repressor LexA
MVAKLTKLSSKQRCIVNFIRRFWLDNSYPPSIRDIVAGCNLSSTSVVDYNLNVLEKKGYLRRHREVSRGIELLTRPQAPKDRVMVPIIGVIAAGQPIPVPDDDTWDSVAASDTLEVTEGLIRSREGVYALKVKGSSMVDALINDGDVVLMHHVNAVDNGEMAAVWLKSEGEATLKKFYAEEGSIRLQPANNQMKSIYASPENIEVQGRVIAVIRQLG